MKVPVYNVRTQRSGKSGGSLLNVSVNPSALTAGTRAFTDTANTAFRLAADYKAQKDRLDNETEITNGKVLFSQGLSDLKKQIEDSPLYNNNNQKINLENLYDSEVKKLTNRVLKTFTKKQAQSLFRNDAKISSQNNKISIMADVQKREIDHTKAGFYQQIDVEVGRVTNGSIAEKSEASQFLFGNQDLLDTAKEFLDDPDYFDYLGQAKDVGQRMYEQGLISAENAVELNKNIRQKIVNSSFEKFYIGASLSKNPDNARQLVRDIANPKLFVGMLPEKRNSNLIRAVNLIDSLVRDQNAKETKQKADLAKQKKAVREQNFSELFAEVANGGEVSTADLANLVEKQELTPAQFKTIQDLQNNKDAPFTDPGTLSVLHTQIMDANTEQEIDDILGAASLFIGENGTIKFADWNSLRSAAVSAKEKTPEAQNRKTFYKSLQSVVGLGIDRMTFLQENNIFLSQDSNVLKNSQRLLANDALTTYSQLTTDPNGPMLSGKDAFDRVLRDYNDAIPGLVDAPYLPLSRRIRAMASFANQASPDTNPRTGEEFGPLPLKISEWTMDHYDRARTELVNDTKLTHLEKQLDYETLDQIFNYMRDQGRLNGVKEPKPKQVPMVNNITPTRTDNVIVDTVKKLFGSSDQVGATQ